MLVHADTLTRQASQMPANGRMNERHSSCPRGAISHAMVECRRLSAAALNVSGSHAVVMNEMKRQGD